MSVFTEDQFVAMKLGAESGDASFFTMFEDCPLARPDLKMAWCMGLTLQMENVLCQDKSLAFNSASKGLDFAIISMLEKWSHRSEMVRSVIPFMTFTSKRYMQDITEGTGWEVQS